MLSSSHFQVQALQALAKHKIDMARVAVTAAHSNNIFNKKQKLIVNIINIDKASYYIARTVENMFFFSYIERTYSVL